MTAAGDTPDAPADHRLFVEFDGDEPCPLAIAGDADVLLSFISWAFSARFGAQHDLALAALRLERTHHVDLAPLLRYADRDVGDEADRRDLERAWQPAAPLAAAARAVADAIASDDERLRALLAGHEPLVPRLRELAAMCDWAAAREARVRLSFDLGPVQQRASRPAPQEHGPLRGPRGRS